MLFKPTSILDLDKARDGRNALRELKVSVRHNTLTPEAFARLTARIQAAFDEFGPIIDESPDPKKGQFYAVAGGARG